MHLRSSVVLWASSNWSFCLTCSVSTDSRRFLLSALCSSILFVSSWRPSHCSVYLMTPSICMKKLFRKVSSSHSVFYSSCVNSLSFLKPSSRLGASKENVFLEISGALTPGTPIEVLLGAFISSPSSFFLVLC